MNQKITDLKNCFKAKSEKLKKFDIAIVFLTAALILFLLNCHIVAIVLISYIYTAFYHLLKSIILGNGISFLNIFVIFMIGFSSLVSVVYLISLLMV